MARVFRTQGRFHGRLRTTCLTTCSARTGNCLVSAVGESHFSCHAFSVSRQPIVRVIELDDNWPVGACDEERRSWLRQGAANINLRVYVRRWRYCVALPSLCALSTCRFPPGKRPTFAVGALSPTG